MGAIKIAKYLIPATSKFSAAGVLSCTVIAALFATLQAAAIFHLLDKDFEYTKAPEPLITDLLLNILFCSIVSPYIETIILTSLVCRLKDLNYSNELVSLITSFLAGMVHLPFKSEPRAISIVIFTFLIFSWYISNRCEIAPKRIVFYEAWIIHGSYNFIAIAATPIYFQA